MAIIRIAAVIILFVLAIQASLLSSDSVVSELSALESKSPSGVIHLSDNLLRRILALPIPRPFYCVIFFDAHKLHANPELSLPLLKSEFALVSSSYRSNNPKKKNLIFFFEIEFQESHPSFALFGIQSLPHIRIIPPSAVDPKTDSIEMDASHYSGLAQSMAEFISSGTNISVGPIHRPPAFSTKQIIPIIAALLIWTVIFAKKLISGESIFLHRKTVWMGGAIFVYFLSVSGAMFNIIRETPFILRDKRNPEKPMFFYPGSGVQLGAEGFAVGFLYTVVGILLALMTHFLVRVRSSRNQRLIMLCILIVMFWAVNKVIFLANWKTGYRIRAYWPSSWR